MRTRLSDYRSRDALELAALSDRDLDVADRDVQDGHGRPRVRRDTFGSRGGPVRVRMIVGRTRLRRNETFEWIEIVAATAALSMESAGVIALRMAGAAFGGPDAADEAWRMWSEKVVALAELQARLLTGSLGATPAGAAKATLKHYRRKVAANRRRLGRTR